MLLIILAFSLGTFFGMMLTCLLIVSEDRDCDDAYVKGYEDGIKDAKSKEVTEVKRWPR